MRFILLVFFILSVSTLWAQKQITGVIKDDATNKPLPFANIVTNTNKGTISDMDGNFVLQTDNDFDWFTVSYVGYNPVTVTVNPNKNFYTVTLNENIEKLSGVTLYGNYNPALEIIKKAINNKPKNNPEKALNSYKLTSYSKLLVTANPDSINAGIDSIFKKQGNKKTLVRLDSSNYKLKKQLEKSHLYITEKIAELSYSKQKGQQERVLATRMAGFKEPIYEILSIQLQSLSFYNNTYTLFGTKYINPIAKRGPNTYQYKILDTVNLTDRPAFMIYFYPKKERNIAGLQGVLYIDTLSYAIQKAIAQLKGVIDVKATQEFSYQPSEKIWFPTYKEVSIRKGESNNPVSLFGGAVKFSGSSDSTATTNNDKDASDLIHLISREYNYNILFNIPVNIKHNGLAITIDDYAHNKDQDFWNNYRKDSLSKRGQKTYTILDSIAEKEKIESKINLAKKLLRGYIPTKYVDIDARNFIKYNNYEGFRLGLGVITNANFSPIYKLNGYGVYGTKDGKFKFGVGAAARLNKETTTWMGIHYHDDLIEASSTPVITDSRKFSLFEPRLFNISQFYKSRAVSAFIEHDLTAKAHAKLQLERSEVIPAFNYAYLHNGNSFISYNLTSATIGIAFTPNNSYLLNRHGKQLIANGYPQISLQASQYFESVFNSDFSFTKLFARVQHEIKPIGKKHVTSFLATGGLVLGNAPLTHLLHASPNQPNKDALLQRFSIAGRSSFETMYFNEFYADRLLTLQIKHTLKPFKISQKISPQLSLISRYALGDIKNINKHIGLTFNSLNKGYMESGLELNKIFKGFGLSAMYRHGAYHLPKFDDNISFKFTFYFTLGF